MAHNAKGFVTRQCIPVSEHLEKFWTIVRSNFDMVAELAFTMRVTTEREIEENGEIDDIKNKTRKTRTKCTTRKTRTLTNMTIMKKIKQAMNIYEMEEGTISMLGKMNIKLPSPTQFDGRYPQFN
eukprot:1677464-Amphidinium_carterae.1